MGHRYLEINRLRRLGGPIDLRTYDMISKVEGAEQVQRLPPNTPRNLPAAGIEKDDLYPSSKPAQAFAQLFVAFSP
jgi:hypothetical protein